MGQKTPYKKLDLLPPKLSKVETINTLRAANKAIAKLAELKGIAQLIPNQRMLINALTLKESKDSSEIENIITSEDELYRAISASTFKSSPETKEVVSYREALNLGTKLIKKQGFIRVNDIIKIQKILIGNNAGIRSTPGTVLKNDKTGKIVYTPPQDKIEINALLSNFISHFNQKVETPSPLIKMAILHYQFESIHPFYDGNGRTGRILNVLYLLLNDMLDIPILYLSSQIIKTKTEYYKYLNQTNKTGKWEEWIIYMLRIVEKTAEQTIIQISKIKKQLEKTIEIVKTKEPRIYRKELIELLFEHPYSKNEYIIKNLGVERKAASRYFKKLEQLKILKSYRIGRETIYVNVSLMRILRE